MTPRADKAQGADEIYTLLRRAASGKQPVAAVYDGLPRLLCSHVFGRNRKGRLARSAISMEAGAAAACGWGRRQ